MRILYELPDYSPPILFSKVFFAFLFILAAVLVGFVSLIRITHREMNAPTLLNRSPKRLRTACGILTLVVSVTVTVLLAMMGITYVDRQEQYETIVLAYQNGDYEIVEGPVEDFSPRPQSKHGAETFTVNGVTFNCPTVYEYGYDRSYYEGGVIRGDGQTVRIGYVTYKGHHVIVLIQEP